MAGYSQEEVAEKIGISRQAYGKWEHGDTVPDVKKCALIAKLYDTTVDHLLKKCTLVETGVTIPPEPKGKRLFGSITISEQGQISIPQAVFVKYQLLPGDRLVLLGDEWGLALVPEQKFFDGLQITANMAKSEVTDED